MSENNAPLLLVDGSSYIYRAYHALPPLMTSSGKPTGAVKGVISMMRRLLADFPDSHVAVVFDAKGKTFRDDIYPAYKANRPPMPDDLRLQIEPIHEIIKALGFPFLMIEGVEADDVIGTLAHQSTVKGLNTIISTGDKDMAQLVSEHVTLLNTMTSTAMDREGVIEKFGIPPELIIDYLALMGDKVDNIPGIPGVGPKTAVKWLKEYGDMPGIIANADKVKGKIGEKLRAHLDQLSLSHELATIRCDIELEYTIEELVLQEPDQEKVLALYQQMEFKSWAKELTSAGVKAASVAGENPDSMDSEVRQEIFIPQVTDINYQLITDEGSLCTLLDELKAVKKFSLITIMSDDHYMDAEIIGVGFATSYGIAYYLPLAHDYVGVSEQLPRDWALQQLKPLMEDITLHKYGHDIKFLQHCFHRYQINLKSLYFDTMLAAYVLNSTQKHDLPSLVNLHLEEDIASYESLAGKGKKQIPVNQMELEKMLSYVAGNADMILRLQHILTGKLKAEADLYSVYQHFEHPLAVVLAGIEANGVVVDAKLLAEQSQQIAQRLIKIEREAYEIAGEEFNLGSPKQLQEIFYQKLQLPILKKTPKGQPSTAEPVLQELAQDYPLPKLILEHRSLSKLKSTYTDKLPGDINARTGRIHTNYRQAVAATGRLSSTDPNLQNIPIRTAEGRRIREAFITQPGYKLMAADYSQIELRIMAHLSKDKGLLDAFHQGLDVHKATAAEVFNVSLDKVSDEQRRSAKAINFGLIYGMSAFGLARQLGIARKDAQQYVDMYFDKYPGVKSYMENTRAEAYDQGFVETLFGRRLYLPDIRAKNAVMRQASERTAINAPMQGTAADIIKQAMIDIDHWLKVAGLDAKMLMQVHDELVFEVLEQDVNLLLQGVQFRMVTAASLEVPLVVDAGVGDNWHEAH